jgi:hypothetical protein
MYYLPESPETKKFRELNKLFSLQAEELDACRSYFKEQIQRQLTLLK